MKPISDCEPLVCVDIKNAPTLSAESPNKTFDQYNLNLFA